MNFKKFLKMQTEMPDDYIRRMSKFSKESPEKYKAYRERYDKVLDYFMEDQARRREGFSKRLTAENFGKYETLYNCSCKISGKTPTDVTME